MALPPKFAGHKLTFTPPSSPSSSTTTTTHTLEFYLDYVCPFSAKLFNTFYTKVVPAIRANPTWAPNLQLIFRQQVQPWHPTSTLTHEVALAVLRLAPDRFYDFSASLFSQQKNFFDIPSVGETRNQIYGRLADLAAEATGVSREEVLGLLTIPTEPGSDGALNSGNGITTDLKLVVKMARLTGVHVSPTVLFDGVVQNDISSGWTEEQWTEWLGKNVTG